MKHMLTRKVYYSDTDAYGVVWHGSYLRWLEAGRVEFCEMYGYTLPELTARDILLPVTNMNVRYKMSARLNDVVTIETEVSKFNGISVTFHQVVRLKDSGKVCIDAAFDVVAISNTTGKLYRRMPEFLAEIFEKEIKCLQPA